LTATDFRSLWMITMNRCSHPKPPLAIGLALLLAAAVPPAAAQSEPAQNAVAQPVQVQPAPGVRQFPAAARRATLSISTPPDILLNGKAERLAPGARIRNTNNTLVMSASLVGTTYIVNYVRESQGLIRDVWLLTEAEAAEKRSGMEPETNFTFQSDANKPRTDDGKTPYHLLPSYPKN
jgi:hypothetical protein